MNLVTYLELAWSLIIDETSHTAKTRYCCELHISFGLGSVQLMKHEYHLVYKSQEFLLLVSKYRCKMLVTYYDLSGMEIGNDY